MHILVISLFILIENRECGTEKLTIEMSSRNHTEEWMRHREEGHPTSRSFKIMQEKGKALPFRLSTDFQFGSFRWRLSANELLRRTWLVTTLDL